MRCVLEFAVAVWTPGLTKAESSQIERGQKCALHVIVGDSYESYNQAIDILGWKNYQTGGPNYVRTLPRG
jgi:hypothetical protein